MAKAIETEGGVALSVVGDAGKLEDVEALLQAAVTWEAGGNKYDIVMVNAGRGLAGGIVDSDESQWQEW